MSPRPKHPKPDSNHAAIAKAIPYEYAGQRIVVYDTSEFGNPWLDLLVFIGKQWALVEIKSPDNRYGFEEYELKTLWRNVYEWGTWAATWVDEEDIERSLELWTK